MTLCGVGGRDALDVESGDRAGTASVLWRFLSVVSLTSGWSGKSRHPTPGLSLKLGKVKDISKVLSYIPLP